MKNFDDTFDGCPDSFHNPLRMRLKRRPLRPQSL